MALSAAAEMALVTGNAEPTAPVGRHQSVLLLGRAHARSWILVGHQVMMSADLERLHKELREFERIDAVSDDLRAVIAATAVNNLPLAAKCKPSV